MLEVYFHKQFKKDIKNCKKESRDMERIMAVMEKLVNEKKLDPKYKLHKLIGNYKDRYECHINPDWLLIFKRSKDYIVFERTGSHSKLFK
ncbi:type II toxin-antitoxin system YafQ family toxin [Candidatus Parcubacteria bacterium]|nr:type II toxin-antitoxin system YafQ family toxin [Candidatus Parcubacteria bacterium]